MHGPDRRRILKFATIGGIATLVLPSKWVQPVVKSVIVPAHAAASPSDRRPPVFIGTLPPNGTSTTQAPSTGS
jgi:hypothetical protein